MSEIVFHRIYHDDTAERAVHGCLENVGFDDTQLPSRGICPVTKREIVLSKEGFCMSADCEKNYTVSALLNYTDERYKEMFSSISD